VEWLSHELRAVIKSPK